MNCTCGVHDKKVDDFDRACKLLEKILHFMEYYEREVETADNVSCNVEIDEVVDFLKGRAELLLSQTNGDDNECEKCPNLRAYCSKPKDCPQRA